MPRKKSAINAVDLSRAIRAAQSAGLFISRTEIDCEGRITLFHSPANTNVSNQTADDALTEFTASRKKSGVNSAPGN